MVARATMPPNIILILTDDQSLDSIPHTPPVMPFLQERIQDPSDHWISFSHAFFNTPLCCPSRATILTGRRAPNDARGLPWFEAVPCDQAEGLAVGLRESVEGRDERRDPGHGLRVESPRID